MVVGITGGIGSGKSLVSEIFHNCGFPVFNADLAARDLLNHSKKIKAELENSFGREIFTNGNPDRKKLAELVFKSKINLEKLNSIVHPEVRNAFEIWKVQQLTKIVFREAAILIESGSYSDCDKIILVQAPEKIRKERVMKRDGSDEKSVELRMRNQWEEEKLIPFCQYFINNDNQHPLIPQVHSVLDDLIKNQN